MKKLLIAAIAFLGISAATFAQTAATPKDTKTKVVKHTDAKAKAGTTAAKTDAATTTATAKDATTTKATTATPLKKDGTPDKRYKANKDAAKTTHLKKDGTADKRFKENKKP